MNMRVAGFILGGFVLGVTVGVAVAGRGERATMTPVTERASKEAPDIATPALAPPATPPATPPAERVAAVADPGTGADAASATSGLEKEPTPPDPAAEMKLRRAAEQVAAGLDDTSGLVDDTVRAAVLEALAPTEQAWTDAGELVAATRGAVLDRWVAAGRYKKMGGNGSATAESAGVQVRNAVLNARRTLADGTSVNVVVPRGEEPELEEALRLYHALSQERGRIALAAIKANRPQPAAAQPGGRR